MKRLALISLFTATAAACSSSGVAKPKDDVDLANQIAKGIAAACPMSSVSDEMARSGCAAKLTDLGILRDHMREPVMWGGQRAGRGYRLDKFTTKFNPFVWRRAYLSLFMFTGEFSVEQPADGYTVLKMKYQLRSGLDIGSYPYPFWHSKDKWDGWLYSPEIFFIIEKGEITGALRSAERDMTRPSAPHVWDGQWQWTQGGKQMPYVSLYTYLFSPNNPHVAKLDTAYRSFEAELRKNACFVCHAPDDAAKADTLEFFNYPNQALMGRHDIIRELTKNSMPPKNDMGLTEGLSNDSRDKLLALAREFEKAGDQALEFEGEQKEQWYPPDMASGSPVDAGAAQ